MGNIGIKINGEWVDLMSAFVPCQLCNEPVQIKNLVDLSQDAVNGTVSSSMMVQSYSSARIVRISITYEPT